MCISCFILENLRRDYCLDINSKLCLSDNKLLLSPPIPRTEEHFCVEAENKPNVHPNARSARLAALANTINQWEDDLSHPSVIKQV